MLSFLERICLWPYRLHFYAGIINDDAEGGTNGDYVTKEAMIAESNKQYDLAIADLNAATSTADYGAIIGKLIPSFCRVGKGLAPTTAVMAPEHPVHLRRKKYSW